VYVLVAKLNNFTFPTSILTLFFKKNLQLFKKASESIYVKEIFFGDNYHT
jgi:hypothetical protein